MGATYGFDKKMFYEFNAYNLWTKKSETSGNSEWKTFYMFLSPSSYLSNAATWSAYGYALGFDSMKGRMIGMCLRLPTTG